MRGLTLLLLLLLAVGVLDHFYATSSGADSTVRRLGLHQDKSQAYWLYFFIAHIYDGVLNPWHWTEAMRDQALVHADLQKTHEAIDVGAGTGFTSIGVIGKVKSLTMVDQSHAQLSKAAQKPELKAALKLVGDAEHLVEAKRYGNEGQVEKIGKYDRYTSAGSIEYWPQPEQGIIEAFRVLKPGGKATIIGPVHPEWWLSKFFADVWYLFPTKAEYSTWFEQAGFEDITLHEIRPEWYEQADRDHGLIMGFVVTGTRPADSADPPLTSASTGLPTVSPGGRLRSLLWLPRFLLGNVGGLYYAVLPVYIFIKNSCFGGSTLATCGALLGAVLSVVYFTVLPMSFRPYGNEQPLYDGIKDFYNKSSGIWERVWGEHMHSGHYGANGDEVDKDPQAAQYDMMEELLAFSGVKREKVKSIIDIGCGVGGSSRYLANKCPNANVIGVTLSPVQAARATELNRLEGLESTVSNVVENALRLPFEDNSFDLAWSLESGEHMPDKEAWLTEVNRVLKPGGTFVCVTWCHRETDEAPLTLSERRHLGRISKNYHLPEWVPLSKYVELCDRVGLSVRETANWTAAIMPFWPAVIWSALRPSVLLQLLLFTSWATIKGAVTAVLMMQGFNMNLLVFGAFVATKPSDAVSPRLCAHTKSKSPTGRPSHSSISRRRTRSSSPVAPSKKQQGSATTLDRSSDSDSIYLYGHRPNAGSFLSAFFRFSYPHTWVGTILSISVVTYIAYQTTTDPANLASLEAPWVLGLPQVAKQYLIALGSALCVNIYIVGINQIFDVEIDRINKPYLPLASGEWTLQFAACLCASLLTVGLLTGFWLGTRALQWTLCVSAALGTAYSTDLPFLRWKRYPILAAGCILCVRSVVVQVGFFSHVQEPLPAPVAWRSCGAITFSVCFILAFSTVIAFFKDLPDIAGDEAAGVRTLAVRIGVNRIFWGCVMALSIDYAAAAIYCVVGVGSANWVGAGAHLLAGSVLLSQSMHVDLNSEIAIKEFYMMIWKLFYAEYFILLLM